MVQLWSSMEVIQRHSIYIVGESSDIGLALAKTFLLMLKASHFSREE